MTSGAHTLIYQVNQVALSISFIVAFVTSLSARAPNGAKIIAACYSRFPIQLLQFKGIIILS